MFIADSPRGRIVLITGHVAGMIDMVALPLWVGTLMQYYGYSAAQAGITVTVFLIAVAFTSLFLARHFNKLSRYLQPALGFMLALFAFALAALVPIGLASQWLMLLLHVVAGIGIGAALSLSHGRMGRSVNPHRLFALANVALGLFAIVFMAAVPQLIGQFGPNSLFVVFAVTMAIAAAITVQKIAEKNSPASSEVTPPRTALPKAAYFLIATVVCLTLNQAMVFSFMERIGTGRSFGSEIVNGVLIATGFVNLIPGLLAALLQKRLSALTVALTGPLVQATLAFILSNTLSPVAFVLASSPYVAVVIFTHVFLFGQLTKLDPTGRVVSATPAMMMLGSSTGPAIGGALVQFYGYAGIGWAACITSSAALVAMLLAAHHLRTAQPSANQDHASAVR